MSLKTEYRGYTIYYSENRDTWDCSDCGVSEATLGESEGEDRRAPP